MKRSILLVTLSILASCEQHTVPPPERLAAMRAIRAEVAAHEQCVPEMGADIYEDAAAVLRCSESEIRWTAGITKRIETEIARHNDLVLSEKLAAIRREHEKESLECLEIGGQDLISDSRKLECLLFSSQKLMIGAEDVLWSKTSANALAG